MVKTKLKKGQIWLDVDPRRAERELEIIGYIGKTRKKVIVENLDSGRQTVVKASRFDEQDRGCRGFKLYADAR